MRFLVTLFVMVIALAGPGLSAIWDCRITEAAKIRGISPILVIDIADGRDTLRIVDVWTNVEKRPPHDGVITSRADGRIKFDWIGGFDGTTTDGSSAWTKVQYIGTFDPARKTLSVRGFPAGFDNEFFGRGGCVQLKP